MGFLIWATLLTTIWIISESSVRESYRALVANCDAAEAFYQWRQRNQGVYIGLSPEGSSLVIELLETYDEYMRTHSFLEELGQRELYLSWLNDFPPQTPKTIPFKKRATRTAALSFYLCHYVDYFFDESSVVE